MHRESEDAKAQLAMEAQIIEKEKEVLAELEAAAQEEEGRVEDEQVEDAMALRNQFNFSERSMQTAATGRKDQGDMTEPPVSVDFMGQVTQADIWDHYEKDLLNSEKEDERKKERSKAKKGKQEEEGRKTIGDQPASPLPGPLLPPRRLCMCAPHLLARHPSGWVDGRLCC
jgi:hypothetical protein